MPSVPPRITALPLAMGALGLLVSFIGLPSRWGGAAPVVAEVVLLLAGAALALQASHPYLARTRTAVRLAMVLLLLMGVGQIIRTKKAFPLMPYAMYGRSAEGDVLFYAYEALHRSGARSRFKPSTVIATLGRARIVKGLARELDASFVRAESAQPKPADATLLRQTLAALIRHHNRRHPADPVTHVEVARVLLPPPYHPSGARTVPLITVSADDSP